MTIPADHSPTGRDAVAVRDRIATLAPGEPIRLGSLDVVPLHEAPATDPTSFEVPDYLTLDEATDRGVVEITETGDGSVPTLRVENKAELPILMVEGEILTGGKQNRILNTSILAAAGKTTDVPVSCVERGRWSSRFGSMGSGGSHGSPSMRKDKSASVTVSLCALPAKPPTPTTDCFASDQGKVWSKVDEELALCDATSPTASLTEAHENQADRLSEAVAELERLTESKDGPSPVGAVALVDGHVVGLDAFDRPGTFRKLAGKLLRGYAVDALRRDPKALEPEKARDEAHGILDRAAHATVESFASCGLGTDHRVKDDKVTGFGLEHDGRVLHLALFPGDDADAA